MIRKGDTLDIQKDKKNEMNFTRFINLYFSFQKNLLKKKLFITYVVE